MINDALKIIDVALKNSDPYKNVSDTLSEKEYPPNLTVIATGKAACTMAKAAYTQRILRLRFLQACA